MFAITVKQPWAYHILNSGKNIENRTWKLPEHHRNTWIALHAAKTYDKTSNETVITPTFLTPAEYGAILGFVKFSDCVENHPSQWAAFGQYHWVISEAVKIDKPIPCRGNLGLWRVDENLIQSVNTKIFVQLALSS
ncbi:MAG: hypothetical protein VKL42_12425 [Snowella sp.]|nr:hypothetical protein [Snowella sp.]